MKKYYGCFFVLVLFSLQCAGPSKKTEEGEDSKSRYDTEIDESVKGEDSAVRANVFSLMLYNQYRYDQDELIRRLQSVSRGRSLEEKVSALTIRRMLGQKKEAQKGLQSLLEQNPGNKLILQNLANAHMDLENYEMARLILLRLLAQNKGDAALHNNLGLLFYRQNEITEAVLAWKRSVKLMPTHVDARLNLAAIAMEHRNFQESFNLCEDVLKNEPRNPDAILCHCTSIMGLGNFKEADACYNKAELRIANWEDLFWNRAFSLYRVGKLKEAENRIEKYLLSRRKGMNPNSPIFQFYKNLKMEIRAQESTPTK